MAPEIKEKKTYDGRKADIFSMGVILFIIVSGHYPFGEAKKDDKYFKHIVNGNFEEYWKKHEKYGQKIALSDDFKDLMTKMLHYDPQ